MTKELPPPLPLKSDEQLRGDNFAYHIENEWLISRLSNNSGKIIKQVNEIKCRELDKKTCHCPSCSHLRRQEVDNLLGDFNWDLDMITPDKRGEARYETFSTDRSWDIKKVIRGGDEDER